MTRIDMSAQEVNNSKTHLYLFKYLNDRQLNELLWRTTNKILEDDIKSQLASDHIYNKYPQLDITTKIGINNVKNDIYILIDIGIPNTIGHITLHLLPYNFTDRSNSSIHIKGTHPTISSRIRLTRKHIGNQKYKLVFTKGTTTTVKNIDQDLQTITNSILQVLNEYFNPISQKSLSIVSNPQKHQMLNTILDFHNNRPTEIARTSFTKNYSKSGGKRKTRKISSIKR